ncbi:MAG: DUF1444 family protein [Alphaproteobacteria bacterium]|nr:DUF1444 family protein [Alphaproteobacteria bacterium]
MQRRCTFARTSKIGVRRPRLMARVLLIFSIIGLLMPDPLFAADEGAFTEEVAGKIAAALPGAQVTVTGALAVSIIYPDRPEGEVHVIRLNRIWDFCSRNARECPRVVSEFVENNVASSPEELLSAQRERLMAVVRPTRYAQHVREGYAQAGLDAAAEFIAGDLWLLCVQDAEAGTRMIHSKDLAALGLSREEAIALAKKNLARHLPPMRASAEITPNGAFGSVDGDGYYGASRLLLHDQWPELARGFKGRLVVAVPDQDRIFFADSGNPVAMRTLEKAAQEAARTSERPISSVRLVWTPDGWREWQR